MPLLSDYARKKKVAYFFDSVPKTHRILEIGCGDGWLGRRLRAEGWTGYAGLDLRPPADIVGDVRDWRSLGIVPGSLDAVVAFEVVEHVPCFQDVFEMLKPGGQFLATSPAPNMDWFCKLLEALRLTQRRTSPHDHLVDFRRIPLFEVVSVRRFGLAAQWGVFRKPTKTRG